jgi:hypothetical protein
MTSRSKFEQNLEIGKVWEDKFLEHIKSKLSETVTIIDNRKTYRDDKNRKVPDFTLVDAKTNKRTYYDAKCKAYYYDKSVQGKPKELFTMDSSFVDSYRSIAEETGDNVYIAFWDMKKDPDHFYILNVMDKEYDTFLYKNEYTYDNRPAYRWERQNLLKRRLTSEEVML